jgi:hypothetical protein
MGFPTSFSSSTIVAPPDPTAPIQSVLAYIERALEKYDADITMRGDGFFEFKVPVASRLRSDLMVRWRLGSTSWPLSFVGSGSFAAEKVRDRVLVNADLRISQYLGSRVALFGLASGAIGALSGPLAALIFGASASLGVGAVCYALAKWEFGFWFQRLDRLLREARDAAA